MPPTILGILRTSFVPVPTQGRILAGGSQAVMFEVASFFLPTDIPGIKGSLWRVGMEKEQLVLLFGGMSRAL